MSTKNKKKVTGNINDEKQTIKTKEFLDYTFTEPELKELSGNLARVTQERINLENEKKAITSEFKAKVDGKEAELESLANKINNGREHRYVDCVVTMNTPSNGKKTLTRLDTAVVVWEKHMTPEEMQLQLDLDNGSNIEDAFVIHNDGK